MFIQTLRLSFFLELTAHHIRFCINSIIIGVIVIVGIKVLIFYWIIL